MDQQTKVVLLSVGLAVGLISVVLAGSVALEARTYARNEKIIADANAAREARMTPEEKKARDAAAAAAILESAKVAAETHTAEALARFPGSARGACLMMLEKSLHDPDSAQFGRSSEWPVQIDQAGRAVVLPRVRAKNGFGAYRLVDYRCVVERVGEDHVKVVSLDQPS